MLGARHGSTLHTHAAMHYDHVSDSVVFSMVVMLIGLVVLYVGFAAYLRWKYGPTPKRKVNESSKRHSKASRRKR